MHKKYTIKVLFFSLVSIILIYMMNFMIDPYGYKSRDNKFLKNLSMFNKPNVINSRINSNGHYYLIGSSRSSRIDPAVIEDLTDKPTHNIKIDGATLEENLLLALNVKKNGGFLIFSFDAFSLNSSRQKYSEIDNRYQTFKNELNKNLLFSKFYNSDITIRSLQHLIKKLKKESISKQYLLENSRITNFSMNDAINSSGVLNDRNKSNFTNYSPFSNEVIIKLAKMAEKGDIFVIFPKYYEYYLLFSDYQDIEKKYFSAIKTLVNNTDAQVWSFYGVNQITQSIDNFIDNGWHFKPQVSNIMFNQIFDLDQTKYDEKFGILVTRDNVDNYLSKISYEIDNLVTNQYK